MVLEVAADTIENWPVLHRLVHTVALPNAEEKLPAAQAKHPLTDVDARAVEYCPASQRVAQGVGAPCAEE